MSEEKKVVVGAGGFHNFRGREISIPAYRVIARADLEARFEHPEVVARGEMFALLTPGEVEDVESARCPRSECMCGSAVGMWRLPCGDGLIAVVAEF